MTNLPTRSTSDLFGDPIGSRPEWYRQDVFAQPEFDYRSYISDLRAFVPFDALRSELRAHSTSLNHELIELVNRNYGDFVSLSTQLVDFDGIVVRMRAPVTEFREKIATLKSSLETSLAALQSGLQQNMDASDIRESLERLLDTSHVVLKVEKLIKELSSVSEHWSDAKSADTSNGFATSGGIAEVGTSLRDTQSMLLERISSEMNRLKFYIAHSQAIHDVRSLCDEIGGGYVDDVVGLLLRMSEGGMMSALDGVRDSLMSAGKSLGDAEPRLIDAVVDSLVEKSAEDLRQVKGITATYRMTNKPLPVRHSPYVSLIVRPLESLTEEEDNKLLASETRMRLVTRAAAAITSRYYDLASDLVTVARRTESSLMRIRQGAQRRAGGGSHVSDHNVSDTDKICMQLFLDVQEYGRCLSTFGVDARDIPSYSSLWHCVAPPDTPTLVSF